ncbi:MAG: pyrroline-5-carboxylate reductase [Bryobacteraceae bacterium]|nr:pyrroline-5-carboxylate reductase [Bryobacteraceae bacterium]MDW8377569.1 pyrroline-5-carboxylate reductase [Bryobacterales bacterium]
MKREEQLSEKARKPAHVLTPGKKLGVIGAGVMGQAILGGLLRKAFVDRTQVWAAAKSDASCRQVAESLGITVERDYLGRIPDSEILILCVKPAQVEGVLEKLKHARLSPDTLLISIAAGPTTERLEAWLGTANPWVRAMPNTPCVVGDGMTVICGGRFATQAHLEQAQRIFEAVGRCVVAEESHFNAVTALSGSGPAYVYLILEALADAGVRVGLRRDLALTLVTQTVLGATKMVQETGRHPAALRDDVTTPAGCTIGGLLMLEDGKIRSVLARAVEEATRIAAQLGKP